MNSHLLNQKGIFTFLATLAAFSMTLNAADTRYKDRLFDVEMTKDVVYATDVPHLSSLHSLSQMILSAGEEIFFYNSESEVTNKPLTMNIYSPKGDSETKRAAVLVSHGGAMVAGSKEDTDQQTVAYCDSLAARGFVAAAIGYRLGVTVSGTGFKYSIDSVDFARTVYRGVQDISAAVRYMRKNASQLGIDPNKIYLVGNSAGAIISLENIYTSNETEFPRYINKQGAPDLGKIDLYGEQGVDSHANGGAFLWGGIHSPSIIGNNNTPVLLIHGTDDNTVLFKTGRPLGNASSMINYMVPEEYAQMASLMTFEINTPTLYGSFVIDSVLKAKNIEHETYFVEGQKHEFYDYDDYDEIVKTKVFDFLYKLAASESKTTINSQRTLAHTSRIQMEHGNRSFSISHGTNLKYSVVDIRGRASLSGQVSAGNSVDLSSLKNGVYMLQVQGMKAMRFNISR